MTEQIATIDSHMHIWDPSRAEYDWLGSDMAPINRAVQFDEVVPSLESAGIRQVVLVEAADNDEDTALMLETAARSPLVAGVVAYVPLEDPHSVRASLRALRASGLVVGVRNLIHNIEYPDWLLRDDVNRSLELIADAGLTFDLVSVLPRHLEHATFLAQRHPSLRIVIDHLSKPPIGLSEKEPWWSLIAQAAQHPNVYAKVSGLYAAGAEPSAWSPELLRPFVHRALEVFGADRLMYGGDWPVSVLAGGYERVWGGLRRLIDELTPAEQQQILRTTAIDFYQLTRII